MTDQPLLPPVTSAGGANPRPASTLPLAPPARKRRRGRVLLALLGAAALTAGGYWGWDRYQARRAWGAAEEAVRRRALADAAAHLDRYTALRPEDPAGWFLSARTARRRGQYADAARFLGRCEKWGGAAAAIRLERELVRVQRGEIGEIDVRLRTTVDPDHPDVAFVLEALARGYVTAERWADARQACELWRAIQPDHPWPWLWGGLVAERQAQSEQAAEFFRRAHDLDPEDREPRLALAGVLVRMRNAAEAAPHYEWLLARDPDDAEALLGLARCRIEAGRAAAAVPLIERAERKGPAVSVVGVLRGRVLMEANDAAGAERWLRDAVRADPGDPEALYQLVACLRAQGKGTEAEPLAARLEEVRRDLRRLTELLKLIGPALADAGPCHEAGVIALRLGRARQGVNLLADALRRKGDHRATHAALAAYYRQAGELGPARHHQQLADTP